jgi:cytochrome c oxidase subunit III
VAVQVDTRAILDPQFDSLEQQHHARTFGMWIFLVTELMLFGAAFTLYAAYRVFYPEAFAEGSNHLDLAIGGINTVVLIVSSLMMALAVQRAQMGSGRITIALLLLLTAGLGTVFLGLKGYEYYLHVVNHEIPGVDFHFEGPLAQQVELFFFLYFAMTGVHAIHLIIGISLVGVMIVRSMLGHFTPASYTPLELTGLYWHFVDIVWVFLLPLLYLIGR